MSIDAFLYTNLYEEGVTFAARVFLSSKVDDPYLENIIIGADRRCCLKPQESCFFLLNYR